MDFGSKLKKCIKRNKTEQIPELALQTTSVRLGQRMSVLQYMGADRMTVV